MKNKQKTKKSIIKYQNQNPKENLNLLPNLKRTNHPTYVKQKQKNK